MISTKRPLALITGASGGLAQAVAARLDRAGWSLALVSRERSRLEAVYGDAHLQIEADCSNEAGAEALYDALRQHDVLPCAFAHCAGAIHLGALHRASSEDIEACLHANLYSAIYGLKVFCQLLHEARTGGSAVLVSSAAARIGTPRHELVSAAKAGLEGLVRGAAASYAEAGIRVNAVAPGVMETPAANGILATEAGRAAAARQYPIGGIGDADELAGLIAWLLSDAASRVTGQVWSVDGGFSSIRPVVRSA